MLKTLILLLPLLIKSTTARIGYFWHITDMHYDVNYTTLGDTSKMCWLGRQTNGGVRRLQPGPFGDYSCDSPWALVKSAADFMKKKHGDNIEFVLWTGDAGSHAASEPQKLLATMQNLTDLLRHTFSSQFVFPALGHGDVIGHHNHHHHGHPHAMTAHELYKNVADMWRFWLPSEALTSFQKGGYYTIENKGNRLRLIILNTNLYVRRGGASAPVRHPEAAASSSPGADDDPSGQFEWLEMVLDKSLRRREFVYVIGHAPPGADERGSSEGGPFQDKFNRRYLQIVRRYANIIAGQFFGHLHSDTFRVIYNDLGEPVNWLMVAPSVTPWRPPSDSGNPGLRLFKYDTDSGQILDYTQFYLELEEANQKGKAEWQPEYNLTTYYGLSEVTPRSLHRLAETFRHVADTELFERYVRATRVSTQPATHSYSSYLDSSSSSGLVDLAGSQGCEGACQRRHYCAVTRVAYPELQRCLRDDAVWSSRAPPTLAAPPLLLLLALTPLLTSR
ncbi:acid sphingomyelinase-like phosphodiesterase 3a [Neocloeon triangulifer]|uniref:acid sphingomyelinase-like phosphodiesterase 3a n=1 Tax=Neocloeon triangulifer TaxID=2078957 RepID=UPI00286F8F16|nr:acid sphingomyelinase-like phosphodiesterase 3a [Neocloeon triangulifer]XP_059473806.1 acid sphingomyelinase-like phosphodiesterase 3a [Neocloeon triangulifer]XP_059473807.1 acid sphingomyelinase-like phosphodiesterase 3a [Neocloeon triangulifer]XP_059473808.1 acid sphingomyelinase-like phosphodiesterase 3a [Neocloeon triangulifer]XP_059473809.1 acid sphingomyelinase-like phosphodiesterase 3a [Neocloeon triangulifer]